MTQRYIRWLIPLLVLTLIVALAIVSHSMASAHAAAPHFNVMWHS